jgi:hypothetical protein
MLINHILKQIVIDFFLMELLSSFEKWVLKLIKKKRGYIQSHQWLKGGKNGLERRRLIGMNFYFYFLFFLPSIRFASLFLHCSNIYQHELHNKIMLFTFHCFFVVPHNADQTYLVFHGLVPE